METTKKELTMKLKALRAEHSGKAIGKMTPEEMMNEVEHHEMACKARDMKAKRLEALAKARESRKSTVSATARPRPAPDTVADRKPVSKGPAKEKKTVSKGPSEEKKSL
jgi:hypothetical protein